MAHDSAEIHVDNLVDSISDTENQQLMDVRIFKLFFSFVKKKILATQLITHVQTR